MEGGSSRRRRESGSVVLDMDRRDDKAGSVLSTATKR